MARGFTEAGQGPEPGMSEEGARAESLECRGFNQGLRLREFRVLGLGSLGFWAYRESRV